MSEERESTPMHQTGSSRKEQVSHSTIKEKGVDNTLDSSPSCKTETAGRVPEIQNVENQPGTRGASNLVAKAFEFIEDSEPKGSHLISVLGLLCLLDIMGFAWTTSGSMGSGPGTGYHQAQYPSRHTTKGDIPDLLNLLSAFTAQGVGGSAPTGSGKSIDPALIRNLLSMIQGTEPG